MQNYQTKRVTELSLDDLLVTEDSDVLQITALELKDLGNRYLVAVHTSDIGNGYYANTVYLFNPSTLVKTVKSEKCFEEENQTND